MKDKRSSCPELAVKRMGNTDDFHDIALIRNHDDRGLKCLFEKYYHRLYIKSIQIVGHREVAEEITQDIFIKIWEKRDQLHIKSSVQAYLLQAVKNQSINYITSARAQLHTQEIPENIVSSTPEDITELEDFIELAINRLPDRCRTVFRLSRFGQLTYQEIADQLGISKETVKSQIRSALTRIRADLHKHGVFFTLLMMHSTSF